jgi:hypothetical protein
MKSGRCAWGDCFRRGEIGESLSFETVQAPGLVFNLQMDFQSITRERTLF